VDGAAQDRQTSICPAGSWRRRYRGTRDELVGRLRWLGGPDTIVLAHITHLDLAAGGVGWSVGQHAPLKCLDEHIADVAAHLDACPIGFGEREAGRGVPRLERRGLARLSLRVG
jgi:hypothetical protein